MGIEDAKGTKIALASVEQVLEAGILNADPRDVLFPGQVPSR